MSDSEITAGRYQLVADLWDEITSKPGEPFNYTRHVKGDLVELNSADALRLYGAGAVVRPGDIEKAALQQAALAYQAALAAMPAELREQVLAATGGAPAAQESQPPADPAVLPAKSAPKADWVAYAVAQGVPDAEAAAASKKDLMDRFAGTTATVDPLGDAAAADGATGTPADPQTLPTTPATPAVAAPSLPLAPAAPAAPPAPEDTPAPPAGEPVDEPQPPAKSAAKADWVAYAVTQGWAKEDAEAATVAQLQEQLGADE